MLTFGSQGLKEPCSSRFLTKAKRIRRRRWVLVMSMAVAVVSKSHDTCAFVVPTLHESHALHQRQWGVRNHEGSTVAASARIRRLSRAMFFATSASLVFESSMYDEQRPRRRRIGQGSNDGMHIVAEEATTATSSKSKSLSWRESWGVELYQPELFRPNTRQTSTSRNDHSSVYHFPQTIDSITSAAARAIDTVLSYHTKGTRSRRRAQPQLPAHAVNSGGRIGIELDFGGGHDAPLHSASGSGSSSSGSILKGRHDEAATVRYASLVLAAKLSQSVAPQGRTSTKTDMTGANIKEVTSKHGRPVAVYFNTLQQALAASQQLLQLKRVERLRIMSRQSQQPPRDTTNSTAAFPASSIATMYDSILIRCLCQGDSIPKEMLSKESVTPMLSPTAKERRNGPAVDIYAGLVLIVQPTDYNDDYQPPGPVVTAVEALQRLAGQASIERLGMVVVSPRFGNHPRSASSLPLYSGSSSRSVSLRAVPVLDRWRRVNGNDLLSSYSPQRPEPLPLPPPPQLAIHDREQSSTYAGREPPRGPSPWIMRDFTPPVFTWVAHTLPMTMQTSHSEHVTSSVRSEKASHLVMWQSILHQDASIPAWHLFAVSTQSARLSTSTSKSLDNEARTRIRGDTSSFSYIASTAGEAGRPTRDVMHQLFVDHEIYG